MPFSYGITLKWSMYSSSINTRKRTAAAAANSVMSESHLFPSINHSSGSSSAAYAKKTRLAAAYSEVPVKMLPAASVKTPQSVGPARKNVESSSAESLAGSSSSSGRNSSSLSEESEKTGMTPDEALRLYGTKLSKLEKIELYSYSRIYYVCPTAIKRPSVPKKQELNNGYDDENGSYIFNVNDHIGYRYQTLQVIGKGSFGQVRTRFNVLVFSFNHISF